MKYKLSEIGRIVTGKTPSTKNKSSFSEEPDKYLFATPRDMNGSEKTIKETERYLTDEVTNTFKNLVINDKSICVSCIGTIGKVFMPSGPAITNQQINSITEIKNFVLPDYLYYYLTIHQKDIENLAGGTTMPIVNKTSFEQLEVEIPDLETQKKIVRILSALDQKIELNNKIRDNLLRVAHQIYINDVKSLPTVKTEKLGSLCKIKYGKGLPTSKILKSGYRVYGGNGIIGFYNEKMYDGSQVLISCRGAASGKVIFTRPECFVTNNSLILECDEKYHYYIKEFSLDREYYDYTTGSAQPQITIDNIKDVELPLPNNEVLTKFNTALCPIEKKFFAILDENEALAKLRDTLLPKLMSGEINLGDIQL